MTTTDRRRDRGVVVTGGAGALGRAIATRLALDGARVALIDSRADACEEAAEDVSAATGADVQAVVGDLADEQSTRACAQRAWDALGGAEVLVNAAGIYPSRLLVEMATKEWDDVFAVNVRAPLILTTEYARRWIADGTAAHVVMITSGAAERTRRGAAHYSSSKAALTTLTKSLALELAPHRIHVNAVSPGFIDADSVVNPLSSAYVQAIESARPWPDPGTPEDVAAATSYLCSADARWLTGTVLTVDGGMGAGSAALPLA
ncbi:MAG TPA: SDR family oxidoreductase [Marmoricola sp.]|nr:SDR family oxidoreductase [Marmoricola sp.]